MKEREMLDSYAYNLGYEAAEKGLALWHNPYDEYSDAWWYWRNGWFDYTDGD